MPKKRKASKATRRKATAKPKAKAASRANAKTAPKKKVAGRAKAKAVGKGTVAGEAKARAVGTAKVGGKARVQTAAPIAMRAANPPAAVQQAPARPAPRTIFDILHPGAAAGSDPSFRDAPEGWTPEQARERAAESGLQLSEDHWEVIRVLQGCYRDEVSPRIRLLRDALEARFADRGGMKYLFAILPGGPIAQGCVLAGLKPPHGARDLSFGSVA